MSLSVDTENPGPDSVEPTSLLADQPRPGPLEWVCLVLVMAPTIALLLLCAWFTFSLIILGSDENTSPLTLLAVIAFPIPLLLVLLFEHQAIVRRSATAALVVGALCLFPLLPGIIFLTGGIKGLAGLIEPLPANADRTLVATVASFLAVTTLMGLLHLRWWRRLFRWELKLADAQQAAAEAETHEEVEEEAAGHPPSDQL